MEPRPTAAAPEPASPGVTVVIPAFNESATVADVVAELRAALPDAELIVVDDGSTDGTGELAAAAGGTVLRHPENRGYGASLRAGIKQAAGDWIVTADADGQHRPEDVARIAAAAGEWDLLVGARGGLLHSPLWRMPGKWLLGWLAQFLAERRIPDLNSGLRGLRRDQALRYLHLCPSGFSFSTTITMAFLCRGLRVGFEPIQVRPRAGGSQVRARHGWQTLILLLRLATLFNPLRLFVPAALACGLFGLAWGLPYLVMGRGVSTGAAVALLTGGLLLALGLLSDQVSQLRLERFEEP